MPKDGTVLWPARPYKGLSYYDSEDVALFAARDVDVRRCGALLALPETRTLVLHGKTGCGKSSFLRAGLIPTLQAEGFGLEFLKSEGRAGIETVFVRSTDAPLKRLAETLFTFLQAGYRFNSPVGEVVVELDDALLGAKDLTEFRTRSATEAGFLLRSLSEVTRRIPSSLILILDQAEEVLTLNPNVSESTDAGAFFDFLQEFSTSSLDLKLLIALRTEYFGRFYSAMKLDHRVQADAQEYLLNDLAVEGVAAAIRRPTEEADVAGYGAPYEVYRFSYEEGLVEHIAQDLHSAKQSGGVLPVMQIVCSALYDEILSRNQTKVITRAQYNNLGRVEGRIDEYVRASIQSALLEQGITLSRKTIVGWYRCLGNLAIVQDDGSVTTKVIDAASMLQLATDEGVDEQAPDVLKVLSSPEVLVLRQVGLVNEATGDRIDGFSLGHDVIGLSLNRWRSRYGERVRVETETRHRLRSFGLVAAAAIGLVIVGLYFQARGVKHGRIREKVGQLAKQAELKAKDDYLLALLIALESRRTVEVGQLTLDEDPSARILRKLVSNGPDIIVRFPSAAGPVGELITLGATAVICCDRTGAWLFDSDARELTRVDAPKELVTGDHRWDLGLRVTPSVEEDGVRFWSHQFAPEDGRAFALFEIMSNGQSKVMTDDELAAELGSPGSGAFQFGAGMTVLFQRDRDKTMMKILQREGESPAEWIQLGESSYLMEDAITFGNSSGILTTSFEGGVLTGEVVRWKHGTQPVARFQVNLDSGGEEEELKISSAGYVEAAFAPDDSALALSIEGEEGITLMALILESNLEASLEWRRPVGKDLFAIGPDKYGAPVAYYPENSTSVRVEYVRAGEKGRDLLGPDLRRMVFLRDRNAVVGTGKSFLAYWSLAKDVEAERLKHLDQVTKLACGLVQDRPWTVEEWAAYGSGDEIQSVCERDSA